ncbi:hypothetical protein E1287_40265 [Actinomadura sp. KC06]|uniref:hypothetical protein n=1 Tax=Actinomadura sp. KC06 TaxID=2530369 RepID=UPI00104BCD2D|nr:hypothetical protein [Actinomadura sp. KC06]TDD21868.1 hypothetical protein E1287_40265 [Actinomadura sp. KC06]
MTRGGDFSRRLLLSVDVMGYGSVSDLRQRDIHRALLAALDEAAERAGLERAGWHRQVAGDGELSVLPPDESEPRVVDGFVHQLAATLRRVNGDAVEGRLRLRLAIHYGTAVPGSTGYNGRGLVEVSRLCDSAPLRSALLRSKADLAVILSRQVFRDVVLGEHTSLNPSRFREVMVREKEFAEEAYLLIPGFDVHQLEPSDLEGPSGAPDARAGVTASNAANEAADTTEAVLGTKTAADPT